ncbi:hypothetical protein MANES_03G105516v8 [Manihot esculenta]|uniref:Uncharacterized protein n=1 Tax=Manihot esculenta TaxID=3983 RepID=A0A2C9W7V2_MANES|nr:hypothetical protein MANES_03G105516v8 [Manihot esculenta]
MSFMEISFSCFSVVSLHFLRVWNPLPSQSVYGSGYSGVCRAFPDLLCRG